MLVGNQLFKYASKIVTKGNMSEGIRYAVFRFFCLLDLFRSECNPCRVSQLITFVGNSATGGRKNIAEGRG